MKTPRWIALAIAVSSIVVSLVVLEVALRIYHAAGHRREVRALPPVEDRYLIESADPRLLVELNPGYAKDGFTVNSWGMPDQEIPKRKPAGVFRIAFVGDSLSCGFGLPVARSEIYLEVLEQMLNEQATGTTRYECLNFGVNGYGVLQSLRAAETRALSFDPDLIVAQGCLNDPYPSDTVYTRPAPQLRSRLLGFLWRRLRPGRFWAYTFVERNYDADGREMLRQGLCGLGEIGKGEVPTLLLLFPYLYRPAYESWGFEEYHRLWLEDAEGAGLPFVDLLGDFRVAGLITDEWPQDPIHPDAPGHRLAAEVLLRELHGRGLLPLTEASVSSHRSTSASTLASN